METQEILQGIHDWTNRKIVYDISVAHPDGQGNPTPYADLTAALGTGGANIPEELRKGGMSVKFVHSSDNNYVQFRYMLQYENTTAGNNAFINPNNWTGCANKEDYKIDDSQVKEIVGFPRANYWDNNSTVISKIFPVIPGMTYSISINSSVSCAYLCTDTPNILYSKVESFTISDITSTTLTIPKNNLIKYVSIVYKVNDNILLDDFGVIRIDQLLTLSESILYKNSTVDKELERLNESHASLIVYSELNLSLLELKNGYVNGFSWVNSESVKSVIIPVSFGYTYKIILGSAANYGVLANDTPESNLMYADGYNRSLSFVQGTNYITIYSQNATCICLVYSVNSNILVEEVSAGTHKDYILSERVIYSDNTNVKEAIDELYEEIGETEELVSYNDVSIVEYELNKKITSSGNIAYDTSFKASEYIPTKAMLKMRIKLPRISASTTDCGIAFYDRNKLYIEGSYSPCFTDKSGNNNYMEYMDVFIPENAAYFRSTTHSDEYAEQQDFDNTIIYKFYTRNESNHITKSYIPNGFIENVIKRAYQYASVEWEPASDLARESGISTIRSIWPGIRYVDKFLANTKYRGIPYSWSGRNEDAVAFNQFAMCVGHQVPIEAFVTAARYSNSYLYDKSVMGSMGYNAVAYGGDCVALVAYAINWRYDGNAWTNLSSNTYMQSIGVVGSVSPELLKPADILQNSNHTLIITDVYYDGETLMIELCEETTEGSATNKIIGGNLGGVSFKKLISAESFVNWYDGFNVYRIKNITKNNVIYTPNEFCPIYVGSDGYRKPIEDLPCIPYMGNKFKFKFGYIPSYAKKVLIGASGFAKLKVYKDGTLLSEHNITAETTQVEIDFSEIGTYTAALYDSNDVSSAVCTWYVE